MLSDPIVLAGSYAGAPTEWRRLKDGLYRMATSNADNPIDMKVGNSFNANGVHVLSLEISQNKPNADTSKPDHVLRVIEQIKYQSTAFTDAEVDHLLHVLHSCRTNGTMLARRLFGEL